MLRVLKSNVSRFRKEPIVVTRRALYKLFVGRLRYGRGDDYDAQRYWSDRFRQYGLSPKGSGHEGWTEQENERLYANGRADFIRLCAEHGVDFESARVLDIGCGNGFYAGIFQELGVRLYLGVDITDVLFPQLRTRLPGYAFQRCDVATEELPGVPGVFDFVVMIDVVQHIVNARKLGFALQNVRRAVAEDGLFFIAPIEPRREKRQFYVCSWTRDDITRPLEGWRVEDTVPFRARQATLLRKRCPDQNTDDGMERTNDSG